MSDIYFTIAGTNHWHGQGFIEPGMEVLLTNTAWPEDSTECGKLRGFCGEDSEKRRSV